MGEILVGDEGLLAFVLVFWVETRSRHSISDVTE